MVQLGNHQAPTNTDCQRRCVKVDAVAVYGIVTHCEPLLSHRQVIAWLILLSARAMSNSIPTHEFIKQNPWCIFCGGHEATTTREHCPPKALFQHKAWPEGYEFPACFGCNNGTINYDRMLAMLARTDYIGDAGNSDGKFVDLVAGVHAQDASQIRAMLPSVREARTYNRRYGIVRKPGQPPQDASPVKIEYSHHCRPPFS